MAAIGSVAGLESLKSRLALGDAEGLRAALRKEAEMVAEEAVARLERDHPGGSGALARSVEVFEAAGDADAPCFAVGTDDPAGRYLEFGTVTMRAAPWLSPSLHSRLPNIKRSIETFVTKLIGRGR